MQLNKNTAKTPHIDSMAVIHAQQNFRSSIKAALNVGIYLLITATGRTKIDDLNATRVALPQQNILRFQIAVNNIHSF